MNRAIDGSIYDATHTHTHASARFTGYTIAGATLSYTYSLSRTALDIRIQRQILIAEILRESYIYGITGAVDARRLCLEAFNGLIMSGRCARKARGRIWDLHKRGLVEQML